jgi:hypothetical protein
MIWPFRKRRKPVHVGPTSVDWKPGDMAECVRDTFHPPDVTDPKVGERLMVKAVSYKAGVLGEWEFRLGFIGRRHRFPARAFRKIVLTDTGADRIVEKTRPVRTEEPA